MDYIREAEKVLWHYKDLEKSLSWQNRQINRLFRIRAPLEISAINYDGMPKGRNNDETMNVLCELGMYSEMSNNTKKKIDEIDEILKGLSDDEGCQYYEEVLRLWYIDGMHKDDIAEHLNFSSRTSIYQIRNEAIRKFAVRLFGSDALKAI